MSSKGEVNKILQLFGFILKLQECAISTKVTSKGNEKEPNEEINGAKQAEAKAILNQYIIHGYMNKPINPY